MDYLFDTYAIIELFEGNKAYETYKDSPVYTTLLNLGEFCYYLLKKGVPKAEIDYWHATLSSRCVEIDALIIKEAMEFKFKNKKKRFSFIDCVGYVAAKRNDLLFLTGDSEFDGLENVEFVSKL